MYFHYKPVLLGACSVAKLGFGWYFLDQGLQPTVFFVKILISENPHQNNFR